MKHFFALLPAGAAHLRFGAQGVRSAPRTARHPSKSLAERRRPRAQHPPAQRTGRIFESMDGVEMVAVGLRAALAAVAARAPGGKIRFGLSVEFPRFLAPPRDQYRGLAGPDAEQRRVAANDAVVELQLRLHGTEAQRIQIVDTAHQYRSSQRIGG